MEHKKWDAVDLARELVQKESTNPGTYEEAVGRLVERYLVSAGVQPDDSEVLPGRKGLPPGAGFYLPYGYGCGRFRME